MVDTINLFEFKRILCCSTENRFVNWNESEISECEVGGHVRGGGDGHQPDVALRCFAWTSNHFTCLAIFLTNATIVLYRPSQCNSGKPSVRHIPWFSNASKQVTAMAFSPNGCWLLLATRDSTVYILPVLKLMEPLADVEPLWPLDDITEIKVHGRRASPTTIVWWDTKDGRSVAVVGNELGEISFINLLLSREVGGTYITVGIRNIELVDDEVNQAVYLLITGSNNIQWQLILERDLGYCWPLESHSLLSAKEEKSGIFASCEGKRPVVDVKNEDTRPKRLDSFAGHTFLKLQETLEPTCIAGYFRHTSILSIHSPDLNVVPLSVYKVPANAVKFVVQEKVLFVVSPLDFDGEEKYAVQILSTELATSSIDGCKEFNALARLQYFYLDSDDELLSVISYGALNCIVVTTKNIYHLCNRIEVDDMFVQIILNEGDIAKAERFGKLFGLNLSAAYEKVGDQRLAEGMVTAAVRLYQSAKCPHIQSVAKFASQGHISEVLSYIRILFANKNNNFSMGELIQFSNMAFLCHLQQCLEQSSGSKSQWNNFRLFVRENQNYDERMAIHLLVKYEMYELLQDLADSRGLFSYLMEKLLPTEEEINLWSDGDFHTRPSWMDMNTAIVFVKYGYKKLTTLEENDLYVECLLNKNLTGCFNLREDLLWRHMKLTKQLLSSWNDRPHLVRKLLLVYNPANLNFVSSLVKNRCDSTYDQLYENLQSSAVCHKSNLMSEMPSYILDLMLSVVKSEKLSFDYKPSLVLPFLPSREVDKDSGATQSTYSIRRKLVSCGYAHSAVVVNGSIYTWGRAQDGCLGRGPTRHEWLPSEPISILQNSLIRVLSVSCGAAHTVAVTDAGVYAWGCNRYGQLGLGKAAPTGMWCQRNEPTVVDLLSNVQLCDIVCGQYHTMALSAEGSVYTWGWGVYGQLGHGDALDCDTPSRVDTLKDCVVTLISAGYAHSLFQTVDGDIFACGCGTFGQLGNGIACKRSTPIKVPIDEKVVLSAAGYFHNVVVGISGRLITWGCNPQTLRLRAQASRRARMVMQASAGGSAMCFNEVPTDCIADISSTPGVFSPIDVDHEAISAPISQVSCGANHTMVLTVDGELFSWGRNLDGQLGMENRKERLSPTAIVVLNDRKVVQISCGTDFTLLLDSVGKLSGFGVDGYGQVCGAIERGKWSQPNVALSPSKIITVRTNRRVVQIKSPTRNSVYKPLLLNGIPQIYDTKDSCEGAKLVITSLISKLNLEDSENCFNDSLHYTLELFHGTYDPDSIKAACIECQMWQAAAKISLLSKDYLQSFELNLKSIAAISDTSQTDICSTIIDLLEMYISLTKTVLKTQGDILRATIAVWLSLSLPLDTLETYLKNNISSLLVPLSYIVFGIANEIEENCPLSTQFCFDVVQVVMEKVSEGELDPDFVTLVNEISHPDVELCEGGAEKESESKVTEESSQKQYVDISGNELDRLRRILPNTTVGDAGGRSTSVVKVFTCGHLYTLGSFHRVALPLLKDSLNYVAPSTTKELAENYANFNFQSMACPKCVVIGFQKDRMELAQMTT